MVEELSKATLSGSIHGGMSTAPPEELLAAAAAAEAEAEAEEAAERRYAMSKQSGEAAAAAAVEHRYAMSKQSGEAAAAAEAEHRYTMCQQSGAAASAAAAPAAVGLDCHTPFPFCIGCVPTRATPIWSRDQQTIHMCLRGRHDSTERRRRRRRVWGSTWQSVTMRHRSPALSPV